VDQQINLVALVCLRCNAQVPAEPDQVAWVCPQCGQGQRLAVTSTDDETHGLVALHVNYAAGESGNLPGKPYWVTEGQVILEHISYSGSNDPARQAQQFWNLPRLFFIPAFDCSLETLLTQGMNLLVKPPALQPGATIAFDPVTLPMEDIDAAADFIVVAIEANRPDRFTVQLSAPRLWILP
jgi:ribosomal protein L40E